MFRHTPVLFERRHIIFHNEATGEYSAQRFDNVRAISVNHNLVLIKNDETSVLNQYNLFSEEILGQNGYTIVDFKTKKTVLSAPFIRLTNNFIITHDGNTFSYKNIATGQVHTLPHYTRHFSTCFGDYLNIDMYNGYVAQYNLNNHTATYIKGTDLCAPAETKSYNEPLFDMSDDSVSASSEEYVFKGKTYRSDDDSCGGLFDGGNIPDEFIFSDDLVGEITNNRFTIHGRDFYAEFNRFPIIVPYGGKIFAIGKKGLTCDNPEIILAIIDE